MEGKQGLGPYIFDYLSFFDLAIFEVSLGHI